MIASVVTVQSVSLLLIGAIVYVTKKWWSAWIAEQVRGDVEERLEKLRSKLRDSESEIAAFREGPLSNVKNTQALLAQRRIKAVDDLWGGVEEWSKFQGTVMVIGWITTDSLMDGMKRGEEDSIAFAEQVLKSVPTDMRGVGEQARTSRPYISDFAWALYTAYFSIFAYSVMVANVFKPRHAGVAKLPLQALDELLTQALPDMADYIKTSGIIGHYHLSDVLRTRLLKELRALLAGEEQDTEGVRRADAIGKAFSAYREAQEKVEKTSPVAE